MVHPTPRLPCSYQATLSWPSRLGPLREASRSRNSSPRCALCYRVLSRPRPRWYGPMIQLRYAVDRRGRPRPPGRRKSPLRHQRALTAAPGRALRDPGQEDPREAMAHDPLAWPYVGLDGDIAATSSGAGLRHGDDGLDQLAGGDPPIFSTSAGGVLAENGFVTAVPARILTRTPMSDRWISRSPYFAGINRCRTRIAKWAWCQGLPTEVGLTLPCASSALSGTNVARKAARSFAIPSLPLISARHPCEAARPPPSAPHPQPLASPEFKGYLIWPFSSPA